MTAFRRLFYSVVVLLVSSFFLTFCGGSIANTGTLVTTISNALTQNPDSNPVTMDTSDASSSVSLGPKDSKANSQRAVSLDLKLSKTAGVTSSFGTIKGWQCRNDSQQAYFTLDISNHSDGTATYGATFKLRTSREQKTAEWANEVDIAKSVSTAGTGSLTIQSADKGLAVTFTGGAVNTLASSDGYSFAWNSSGLACGQKSGGAEVSFEFSVDSTTKEKSGETSNSDSSLCSSLPSAPTYSAPAAFTGSEIWDCLAPTNSTLIRVSSAPDLEEDGGSDCVEDSSYWKNGGLASITPGACGSSDSVTDLMCRLKTYFAIAAQAEKAVKRSLECKFEGVAQMAANGDITGFSEGLAAAANYHILNMSISTAR